jgi:amino acid adenylation domain-containing protein
MSTSKAEDKKLSPLKRALIAVKDMRDKLEAAERTTREPVAIVGMACRFPGSACNIDAYWRLLESGVDAISEVPQARWDVRAFYDPNPETPGKMYTREGGFLDETDKFDAAFFGITPREATLMDPQQRLLLEVGWEALEHAAIAPDRIKNSLTGVFVGISVSEYMQLGLRQGGPDQIDAYSGTGGALSVAAGRLSYFLRLHGPAISIDTACSSSLVAIDQAMLYLKSKKCDLALAGGVNFMLSPESTIYLCKVKALSRDGRCKAFDISADGYGRGEGCGIIVLKRLSDAQADGDRILAVIRGSAVNHDGRSSGLTVPNGAAQQEVIRAALANAELDPSQIDYIEAHGTGTALGDPIEIRALDAVFGKKGELLVGTAKTNIGHLEPAAGVAGVIKVVLALQNGMIPPHLHLKNPSPHIPWDDLSIRIPGEITPWPADVERPVAGVSSFGFSGTNAHIILQAASEVERIYPTVERPLHVLPLSVQNETALQELAERYVNHWTTHPDDLISDVCFTAGVGRSHFSKRLAVVSDSSAQLAERLTAFKQGKDVVGVFGGEAPEGGQHPKVAFLFTGQGSQYVGMGRELYQTQPTFRKVLDDCDELLGPNLEQSLVSVLYPEAGAETEAELRLNQTGFTQPALFALEYALAQLWRSWGVEPSVVMGHSVGEYVAACMAGVFSLQDGLKLIAARGRLMDALPAGGATATVFANEARVTAAIAPYRDTVSIAAINGAESIVISGAGSEVEMILKQLESEGIRFTPLNVSHALHSPLIEPMLAEFEKTVKEITFSKPQIKLISNLTGQVAGAHEIKQPAWWCRHVRQPVRFAESMRTLEELGYKVFVEVGAHPVLLGMGQQRVSGDAGLWLPSLRRGRSDWQQMLESLGTLYVRGVEVDWEGFDRDYARHKISLPTYPFQRKRYWIDTSSPKVTERKKHVESLKDKISDWLYEIQWQAKELGDGADVSPEFPLQNLLILADRSGLSDSLAERLRKSGVNCTLVFNESDFKQYSDERFAIDPYRQKDYMRLLESHAENHGRKPTGIIHMWALDSRNDNNLSSSSLAQTHHLLCGSVLNLFQVIESSDRLKSTRLWLVTRGVQSREMVQSQAINQAPLWGLGRVAITEFSEFIGGLIDLDPRNSDHEAEILLQEILESDGEKQVAFHDNSRRVARLVPKTNASASDSRIHANGSYLITGGLGGLGLRVARWIAEQGARHLVVIGRNAPSQSAMDAICEIESTGAKVRVRQADVTQEEQVKKIIEELEPHLPPLRGVLHLAGVLDDGLLIRQSWDRFARVMAPKVAGGWNLHAATKHLKLDFFVLFSSASSVFGSAGQGNYAAANAFLDALASYRHCLGLPGVAIEWGPWTKTGMTADMGSHTEKRLTGFGLEMIPSELGLKVLGQVIGQTQPQVCVLRADWPKFIEQFPGGNEPPFFAEICKDWIKQQKPESSAEIGINIPDGFNDQSSELRKAFLKNYLRDRIGRVIDLARDEIPSEGNFMELGLDSLMIMELINFIRQDFNLSLYVREVFEKPTVLLLAEHLESELKRNTRRELSLKQPGQTSPAILNIAKVSKKKIAVLSDEKNPSMVFLLSSPRSGSTLLRVMLAGHSHLFCPPELHLLPFSSLAERRDLLGESYLTEGLEYAFMKLKGIGVEESRELIVSLLERDETVQQIYRLLQESAHPRLLVDKSPTYASDIETLEWAEKLFDRPKYIHLARHPFSVIESFIRNRMERLAGIETEDPGRLAEHVWCETNANIIDFFIGIDPTRHYLVYYEDLVRNPEKVMRDLCSFLKVPFEEALLKPYEGNRMVEGLHTSSVGIGDPNFLNHDSIDPAFADSWKKVTLGRRLSGFSRRVARELNYDFPKETAVSEEKMELQPQRSQVPTFNPVTRDKEIPLSYQQQRLWFLNRLDPGNAAYNMPALVFRMKGLLDEDALQMSLNEIVRRHEILRTTFREADGRPVQIVAPEGKVDFKLVNFHSEPANLRENMALNFVTEEMKTPFDLEKGPLFRTVLIRLRAEDHILALPIHHIVSDGWSFGIIIHELSLLYNAFLKGIPSTLPELAIQYADYTQWQRQWMQGKVLEDKIGYWKKQLGENLPVLVLPYDHPRPALQTANGARESITMPGELVRAVKSLSGREGVTLFMTLLAAFKVLLYRYSGQDDIVVGTPVANRNHPDIQHLIGFFVNTLVLRSGLSGNPSFCKLLKRISELTLDAYDHQDIPFEKLVEVLVTNRDMSRSPLFQVMFVLQNTSIPDSELPGITARHVRVDNATSKFDLWLSVMEREEGLFAQIEYNTDLFEPDTIRRMLQHYQTLLQNLTADPHQHIDSVIYLTESERHQITQDWNETHRDYDLTLCLHELFEKKVEQTPDSIALVFEGEKLTYRQLNDRANRLAQYLQSFGVEPETFVGVCMERSLEMVVALYGTLKAGAAYVPIDPTYPAERQAFMMADAQASLILTQAHLVADLPKNNAKVICLDSQWNEIVQQSKENPQRVVGPENLAYMIYTSGSTGKPKGVMNTHQAIVNRLLWMQEAYPLTAEDRVLQKTPFSFDVSVWEFFWPLIIGSQLVMAVPEGHRDRDYLIDIITKVGITTMHFVPSMLQVFLDGPGLENCSSLKHVICSGEALSYALQERCFQKMPAGVQLHNLYGPTEAAVDVTFWECQSKSNLNIVPIGRPIANTQLYILDKNMIPVPVGVPGELHIGGVQVARGYHNRPELTEEKFISDPFSNNPEARLYKTGDLTRYLPDGNIEYLGRMDFQVKIRGFRIELGEIEAILCKYPGVREAVVNPWQDQYGQNLAAYIVLQGENEIKTSSLRKYLSEKLPDYMVPSAFMVLDSFPLTPSGKADRKALPGPDNLRTDLAANYAAPQSYAERAISAVWEKVLNMEKVGINNNFFELGGHSLLLAQVNSLLREVFKKDISMVTMFQYPTIASLAKYLNYDQDERPSFGEVHGRVKKQKEALNRRRELEKKRRKAQ